MFICSLKQHNKCNVLSYFRIPSCRRLHELLVDDSGDNTDNIILWNHWPVTHAKLHVLGNTINGSCIWGHYQTAGFNDQQSCICSCEGDIYHITVYWLNKDEIFINHLYMNAWIHTSTTKIALSILIQVL